MTQGLEDPRTGDVVNGRYRLGAVLGRGAHGVVFHAKDVESGRDVALKMLLLDASQPAASVGRFVREAELAKKLTHPNTVQIVDFGQTEIGLPFIVWELLRGRTLAAEIARAPLSVERTGRVAGQVLSSLAQAHALGIVHRDIKPENVYLAELGGDQDFVKVLDFGVARNIVAADPTRKLTLHGQMIGTPSYMAPEQVKSDDVGPATDLYALGLVMAEAMSGTTIVQGDSDIRVWTWQASDEPVVLPDVVLTSALGLVIARATRKDLSERYASCQEMLADMESALSTLARAPASADARRRTRQMTARLGGAPAWPGRAAPPPSTPPPAFDPRAPTTTQHLDPRSLPPRNAAPSVASVAPPAFPHVPPVQATPVRTRSSKALVIVAVAVVAFLFVSFVLAAVIGRRPKPRLGSG